MANPNHIELSRGETSPLRITKRRRLLQSRQASLARQAVRVLAWAGPKIAKIEPLRRALVKGWENKLWKSGWADVLSGKKPPGVACDRTAMGIAIVKVVERVLADDRLSSTALRKFLNVLIGDAIINQGELSARQRFLNEHGVRPPEILLISPTKSCNLLCKGCYADSSPTREKLEWDLMDRMIQEVHDLWGGRFIVISGGEPLIYRDDGRDILHLAEKHSDCFFMMYTNGTLIDDKVAQRISRSGNIMPAISVEGMRERTDERRGVGVFDRTIAAMERLRREKVFFGISLTATRDNVEEILSDEVIDFYFEKMGALFAWIFQYMPIGRSYTLELLPTPEQRHWMWKRSWQIVYERKLFLADFWNSGSATHGCISAGREGGYMAVDWNGNVIPCVFLPYSPINIRDVYARGKTLNDVWAHPFFQRIRRWQYEYGFKDQEGKLGWDGNLIMPCPIRDHYADFYELIKGYELIPVDENAAAALRDPDYRQGLIEYNRAVAELLDPVWKTYYLKNRGRLTYLPYFARPRFKLSLHPAQASKNTRNCR